MPKTSSNKKQRNYRKEYDDYYGKKGSTTQQQTQEQRVHRAEKSARNKARAIIRKEQKTIPAHMDVDHKDGNPLNNHKSNLQLMCRKRNRGKKNVNENL